MKFWIVDSTNTAHDISSCVSWVTQPWMISSSLQERIDKAQVLLRDDYVNGVLPTLQYVVDQANFVVTNSRTTQSQVETKVPGTRIFAGNVAIIKRTSNAIDMVMEVHIQDYTESMTTQLANQVYKAQTDGYIIGDMLSRYGPGIINQSIPSGVVIDYIRFNYIPLNEALDHIASYTGYRWWIDYYGVLYFQSPLSLRAPINISSNPDQRTSFALENFSLSSDTTQLRNDILVVGGYQRVNFNSTTPVSGWPSGMPTLGEKWVGGSAVQVNDPTNAYNGDWALTTSYPPVGTIALYINNLSYDVGPIDGKKTHYAYIDRHAQTLYLTVRPNASSKIWLQYQYDAPIVVRVRDAASIKKYGTRQYKIVHRSLLSQQGAVDRANVELRQYRQPIITGQGTIRQYETDKSVVYGLRSGQRINVYDSVFGINYTDCLVTTCVYRAGGVDMVKGPWYTIDIEFTRSGL